ncbi:MAG: TraB/GumN family protein [Deltaproteobacteria bacterium]|nr:TraB/GumN family protein [Deltaproteobacteria bacterium]
MDENPNIHKMTYDGKEIILIGTAHVSKESADLVAHVIETERPETVSIELCQARYHAVTQKNLWQETNLIKVIQEKKAFFLLVNLVLASFQKRIGKKLGIQPGQEMIQAIQTAQSIDANIHLADRDIRVTLSRAMHLMGFWTKLKLMTQFILSLGDVEDISAEDVEKMKDKDVLESILAEIGEALPGMKRILIDERDQYLAYQIRNAPGKKIVAIVGAGHVQGIQKNWNQAINIKCLEQMPPKRKITGLIKWGVPAFIIGLIIMGFFMAGATAGKDMIRWWVLANSVLAGLGALAALAHPFTILTAIIAAPLTSLNPLIAAGWVAGLTEILLGKPKVKDFDSLPEDITSVRGFWKNKVTRILLVVVFTNLGSSFGTFVAIPLMAKALA